MTESELNQLMINAGTAVNEKVSKDLYAIIRLIIISFFSTVCLVIGIFLVINFNKPQKIIYKKVVKYKKVIKYKNNINFIDNDHLIDIKYKGKQKCFYYRKSGQVSEFYTICK